MTVHHPTTDGRTHTPGRASTAPDGTRARRRSRLVLAVVAPAVMAAYVWMPGAGREVWFQMVAWCSIAVFRVRMHRHRATSLGWSLVLCGFVSFGLGDLLFALDEYVLGNDAFPSIADLFYLAGYPAIATGLAALVRTDARDRSRTALIDAGIVVVPITVIGWLWFVEPVATGEGLSALERVVSAAYPIGDLLCIALVVRLLTGATTGRRRDDQRDSLLLVVASLTALLLADGIFLAVTLHGEYASGGWSDALYLLAYLLLGATAARPAPTGRAGAAGDVDRDGDTVSLTQARLVLLASAALVTPIVMVVQWWRGDTVAVPLVVAGTSVSFLLVVARMAGLVQALDRSRAELRFEARHDLLTGLPNRQQLAVLLDETLAAGDAGALLFVDLDRFKAVNDTFGHAAGDEVLVEVASILRRVVRPTDVVARLAGDEFVVMVRRCDPATAADVARRVVERLCVVRHGPEGELAVTASVGMVPWPRGTDVAAADRLMLAADQAMYEAKHASGNRWVLAAP